MSPITYTACPTVVAYSLILLCMSWPLEIILDSNNEQIIGLQFCIRCDGGYRG